MTQKTIATFECKVIKKEFLLVGESITANFPQGISEASIQLSETFNLRREEVQHAQNIDKVICPYMCNGILATYLTCLEVDQLGQIPAGMIGFKIPETEYAVVSCSNKTIGEGYDRIFSWIQENGFISNNHAFSIEVFYYEENVEEKRAEILIPIQQT